MASHDLQPAPNAGPITFLKKPLPPLIVQGGRKAMLRFVEYFTANIRNPNTRAAYAQDIGQFCAWADAQRFVLEQLNPIVISVYVEQIGKRLAPASVKRHLAAIRMLFDWFVIGQIIPFNPAASVRGPKHVVKRGKTPVLPAVDARALLDSIDVSAVSGLRDRALIGVMLYTFARVSAAIGMDVEDYRSIGRRSWIRLTEKGGKHREVPAHHNVSLYLDAYLAEAGIADEKRLPLFRSLKGRTGVLSANRMSRGDALRMIKRRAAAAGLPDDICNHTFRGTGITAYLANGGTLETAQAIAGHESPETTKLYDRTEDELTLDEIERIAI